MLPRAQAKFGSESGQAQPILFVSTKVATTRLPTGLASFALRASRMAV
ncbi:hypothetical protein JHFBIEKO_4626 [Methylobacterium mesophilicum]|nr:hypothetical protein JHFBIEKO_4626 [Methylobacterium mesophilicum]